MKNKRGFTLIELLAVIVILAILITTAIPAVSRYLDSSRKDTYVIDVSQAVNTIRTKALQEGVSSEKVYTLADINSLLDKKLSKSPYGKSYDNSSYIKVVIENEKPRYKVCIVDTSGNGIYNSYDIEKNLFVSGNPNEDYCHAEDDLSIPTCTWTGPYSDSNLTTNLGDITQSTTVYYGLECTDDTEIKDALQIGDLSSSNTSVLSNITIVDEETITNGYKYTISGTTGLNIGSANIVLAANAIKDRSNKGNELKLSANTVVDKIYVYKAGNQYTNITGGWKFVFSSSYGGYSRDQDNELQIYVVDANTMTNCYAATNNTIDVTNYNKIVFNITTSSIFTTYAGNTVGIINTNALSNYTNYEKSINNTTGDNKLIEVDISTTTGSFYVAARTAQNSAGTGASASSKIHISEIYFE